MNNYFLKQYYIYIYIYIYVETTKTYYIKHLSNFKNKKILLLFFFFVKPTIFLLFITKNCFKNPLPNPNTKLNSVMNLLFVVQKVMFDNKKLKIKGSLFFMFVKYIYIYI